MIMAKLLIACEESQVVCKAFRAFGIEAYYCDIQEPSGGHPEWHILGDALEAVQCGLVRTMDGQMHNVGKWDMLIAHPPCTYLSKAGANRLVIKGCIQDERKRFCNLNPRDAKIEKERKRKKNDEKSSNDD